MFGSFWHCCPLGSYSLDDVEQLPLPALRWLISKSHRSGIALFEAQDASGR